MEIVVEGKGILELEPNQITINFELKSKDKSAEIATQNGLDKMIKLNNLLKEIGFNHNDLRTQNCRLNQNQTYNEAKRCYVPDGYEYLQTAKLSFHYDLSKLAEIRLKLQELASSSPTYSINFERQDSDKITEQILDIAYKNAVFQAKTIATSANKQLVECAKISFEPFEQKIFQSNTDMSVNCMMAKGRSFDDVAQTIIPEKISITKTIYCVFIAK